MPKKRISLKGLADFMVGSPAKQRSIVHDYKYPKEDEPRGKATYYKDAMTVIEAFHRRKHDRSWLLKQADDLETVAKTKSNLSRTKLINNARTLRDFAAHLSIRHLEVLKQLRLGLNIGDVYISIVPDLCVKDKGRQHLIKFNFSEEEPKDKQIKAITQAMYEAASEASIPVVPSDVWYVTLSTGTTHKGARMGSRMKKEIEASCATISAIWDTIEK